MLGILNVATGPYRVTLRSTGIDLMQTDDALKPGQYDIRSYSRKDKVSITDEPCIIRILSRTITGRDDIFRPRIRERDGKDYLDDWRSFEAAHIFPVSSEEYFLQKGYSRWTTNRIGRRDTGINSCQNGLLMLSNIHQKFDSFKLSINPDDGYKITCFDTDIFRIDGRTLNPICRDHSNEKGVRDELLRWHFRQAVLANMRRAGEPIFEMDFPPGSDVMGEILIVPKSYRSGEGQMGTSYLAVDS
ncbi:hypothetical protein V1505DRAFT_417633 [Lipomyces doorenjongii]